ncbi:hypothetical protein PSACC_03069 [Paramicrosporidium saccamoebae]|uniref:Uncharacterized protein n=1 Tax=Paramicrosporidium saccamoebae TaxID=1246581 RepID=A0A2H9THA6_9FUNG|nr:hypothetical protein PSACC_03069 [Paramicrosporidium saccamoebae]
MNSSTDEFYESSRRAVAVLLLFWLSYVLAYTIMAWVILPSRPYNPLSRKRRSNLSRLMLLGRPERRPRSLPPARTNRHLRTASLRDIAESEGDHSLCDVDSLSRASDTDAGWGDEFRVSSGSVEALSSRHILSSFAPEYTAAVCGLAVVIQGILLVPASLAVLAVVDGMPEAQRLFHGILLRWWHWAWNAALILIFAALPVSSAWIEGRGRRDAPILKKLSILCYRLVDGISRWGLLKPLLLGIAMIFFYLLAVLLGFFSPINLNEWAIILNIACIGTISLASLVCIPLGVSTIFRNILALDVVPGGYREATDQLVELKELKEQILSIETTLAPQGTLRRNASMPMELTPVSSKSLRSKLIELRSRSSELQSQLPYGSRSGWRRMGVALLVFIISLSLAFAIYVEVRCFIQFIVTNLLWYIPGVQLVDRLLYQLALLVGLVHVPSVETRPKRIDVYSLIISAWMSLMLMTVLFIGLRRLVRRRLKSVHIITAQFSLPRRTLDKFIAPLMIGLASTILFVPLLSLSGATDYIDSQITAGDRINSYVSPLASVFPPPLRNLFGALHHVVFLRFPLLVWLIMAYRGLLILVLVGVGTRSVRASIQLLVDKSKSHIE